MPVQLIHRAPPSHISRHHRQLDHMQEIHRHRRVSLQASLAEMTLVNRLRSRTRTDLSLDTLQRGAAIIELTAKHWFAGTVDIQQSGLKDALLGVAF
jgi:hypothetical protein